MRLTLDKTFGSIEQSYSMVEKKNGGDNKYYIAIPESTMRIRYSKVQKHTFFNKSLVLKRLRESPGSRSPTLNMLTVITREPIKSCPVALPLPKGFGRGLARPLTNRQRRFARVLLLTRKFRTLTLPPPFCFLPWSRIVQKGQTFSCFQFTTSFLGLKGVS